MQPADASLVIGDFDSFIDCDNTNTLGNWIATRRPVIFNRSKKAPAQSTATTKSILTWFLLGTPIRFQRINRWTRNKLLFDPYLKKKRQGQNPSGHRQPSVSQFLAL